MGEYHYEIKVFLKYTLPQLIATLLFNTLKPPFASLTAQNFLLQCLMKLENTWQEIEFD